MSDVIFLGLNDNLRTLLNCFQHNMISHVPVVEEGKLIGMVSKTDVTDYLSRMEVQEKGQSFKDVLEQTEVKELMIQPVIKADISEPRSNLLQKLNDHQVGSVVLTENGKVAGIVTATDLLQFYAANSQEEEGVADQFIGKLNTWMHEHGVHHISKALSDIGI